MIPKLRGRTLDRDAAVVVCTIHRLYAALRGLELDEADEESSGFEHPERAEHQVGYSAAIPPETFDLVVVDECHRSIYGTRRQVLDYFDAFLVGLTATPGRYTLGFFAQNLVSEYPFERSVADGVNVGFDVYRIRPEVGDQGGTVQAGYAVPLRDRATRRRRMSRTRFGRGRSPQQSVVAWTPCGHHALQDLSRPRPIKAATCCTR